MDKNMFKSIEGIELFWSAFPDISWCYFHEILEFRWYRKFDNEDWIDRSYFELKMSGIDGKDIILFLFKDAVFMSPLSINGYISGLDIINKSRDYQNTTYEIIDFEDQSIHMVCSDFSIKVLQINGISVK